MNKAWKPFYMVCNDVKDPFDVQCGLALAIDLILLDLIEGLL